MANKTIAWLPHIVVNSKFKRKHWNYKKQNKLIAHAFYKAYVTEIIQFYWPTRSHATKSSKTYKDKHYKILLNYPFFLLSWNNYTNFLVPTSCYIFDTCHHKLFKKMPSNLTLRVQISTRWSTPFRCRIPMNWIRIDY